MKLDSEDRALLVAERADRVSFALSRDFVALGRLLDVVAVTHPRRHRLVRRESLEQSLGFEDFHLRAAVFSTVGANDLSAFDVRDQLHSVADSQHRRDVEDCGVGERDVVAVNRVRSATQNDAGGLPLANPLDGTARRMNLGVDSGFANPAGDQLRKL